MRVEWATFCDDIDDGEAGVSLKNVNRDTGLFAGGFPATGQLVLAVCLLSSFEELGTADVHFLRVAVRPVGSETWIPVLEDRIGTPYAPEPLHSQLWRDAPGRAMARLNLTIGFPVEGRYDFAISVDDTEPVILSYLAYAIPSA